MPEAVYLSIRCLTCERIDRTSVGLELTKREREETAESFVWYAARSCRDRHAGVEAVFSDHPRRIIFSRPRWPRFLRRGVRWVE